MKIRMWARIAALCLVAWIHTALAAIDVGQFSAGAFGNGTTLSTTGINTTASGSSFVIFIMDDAATSRAASDNKGNTYSQVGTTLTNFLGFGVQASEYLCTNCTGGTGHTATATLSNTANAEVYLIEITGGATSSLVDALSSGFWNDDSATPFTSNNVVTSNANDLLLAFTLTNGSSAGPEVLTWGNSFTQVVSDGNTLHFTSGIAKRVVSSTGTYNSSYTSAGAGTTEAATAVISFKAASGGGGCTHNFWKSTGAFAQPDGTTGSYWSSAGAFATPNCTSGSYWRQDGTFNSN